MIKCIATDMDGTLLNAKQEVSEENIRAIHAAQEKGIDFVLVTGRAYNEVRYVLRKTGLTLPAICVNGGEIRDIEGNVSYSVGLDGPTGAKITSVFEDLDIYFELYTTEGTYTTDYEKGIQVLVDIYHTANPSQDVDKIRESADERFNQRLIHVIDNFNPIFDASDCHVYKFLAFSMDEELLMEASERLKKIGGLEVTSSGRNNLEVMHHEARKGNALRRYVEDKGISLEETMAMGDNYNDLSMLKIVGHSVAMGNSEPEIKDICKYETDTNDENGVAKAIMKALVQMEATQ
ncbi:Cof-type HAD-IIB family hydrolase [Lederbergia wuyishanensis]|uniref:Cof subfamily protein (Haloacid dehalogenase superfamily) n=1 Tax=Lederbergia wuyishanensis TaxID=1347903 RepID=A0ABU0D3L3_9BACI|nr:Cof-type HAD-IIB family hydrolase [Lederbergia wuyishanensis]MCJ8007833.1 Cof-type HAD-IIB family hydrolase [Lederbergia wuyishanensis]MDQ0342999.1 Cof subfamily protein (haloacid dehalogenase superfamily) [Lederbergia wuyishanensis]